MGNQQFFDVTTITVRQGNENDRYSITPLPGELIYTLDTKRLYVGDGETPGGIRPSGGTITIGEDIELILDAGDGLSGGGDLIEGINVISLGHPSSLDATTSNQSFNDTHTHEIKATSKRDIDDNETLLMARALKEHIEQEQHGVDEAQIDPSKINHNKLKNYNPDQHINHANVDIIAGYGLTGGGNLTETFSIELSTPQTIDGQSLNSVAQDGHTHYIDTTSERNISDDRVLLLAKGMKEHIQQEPHVPEDHNHHHDELDGFQEKKHVNHENIQINAGSGLKGGGNISQTRTIRLGTPNKLDGTTQNLTTDESHTHKIDATDRRDVTDSTKLLLAKALKDHIQHEPHTTTDGTDHNHDHNLLINYVPNEHINHNDVGINAGDGLDGGGKITSTREISLKTPGTLSGESNNNSTDNHTHKIEATSNRDVDNNSSLLLAKAMKEHLDEDGHTPENHNHDHNELENYVENEHINHNELNIIAGDGLDGGGLLIESLTIDLKRPGQLTAQTTNNSEGNHTHIVLSSDRNDIDDDETLLRAKGLKNHLENDPHIPEDHNHDHNELENYAENEHINHSNIQIVGNMGLAGGGNLTDNREIRLRTPGTLTGQTDNKSSSNHTHNVQVTDRDDINDSETILLARGLKDHIDNYPHLDPSSEVFNHNELEGMDPNEHIDHSELFVHAGNGLNGGGDLLESRTVNLGTPETITGETPNDVSSSSHTHEVLVSSSRDVEDSETLLLAKALKEHIDEEPHVETTSHNDLTDVDPYEHMDHREIIVRGGDGLIGSANITSEVTIRMGQPSSITPDSDNNVSSDSHTHEIAATTARDEMSENVFLLARAMRDHEYEEGHLHASAFVHNFNRYSTGDSELPDQFVIKTPFTLTAISENEELGPGDDGRHTHEILTTDTYDADPKKLLAAPALYNHLVNMLDGGFTQDSYDGIYIKLPGTLSAETNNDEIGNHTHQILTTDTYEDSSEKLLSAKSLYDHLANMHFGGFTQGHNGYIYMKKPATLSAETENDESGNHTHKILTTDTSENNSEKLLTAKGLYDHEDTYVHLSNKIVIDNQNISGNDNHEIAFTTDRENIMVQVFVYDGNNEWIMNSPDVKIVKTDTVVKIYNETADEITINAIIYE